MLTNALSTIEQHYLKIFVWKNFIELFRFLLLQ